MENPAISVIIPLFNAEEFVGECLDSLLLQTFQDFEVIVVDDCSTDNSVAVVESYRKKFGDRLTISRMEKNSGGGGYVPRNIGLSIAKGEYIYFADADDLVLLTALETLYTAAKENDADVVYFSGQYWIRKPRDIIFKNDETGIALLKEGLEDEPVLVVDDTDRVLKEALLKNHHRTPWTKFIRRTLLTENNILFPEIIVGGDVIWTYAVYTYTKRFLRLPVSLYFLRRYHSTSVIKTKRSIAGYNPELNIGFIAWLNAFNELANKIEFMKKNLKLCCQAVKDYFEYFVRGLYEEDKRRCFRDIRNTLLSELPAERNDGVTVSFLKLMTETATPYSISTCAVSVVVSLYNYGRYVGECLDSLLAQTFTNFEVIVVDDCSTDNGVEVVKSYRKKFGDRLKFTQTEVNSGGGGTPRNIGLGLASGEYIFFMDADDALIPTALEEMFKLAKEYYADVVYCEKYFTSEGVGQKFKNSVRIADIKCQKPPFVNEPTLEIKDMAARVNRAIKFNYWVTAWLRLVRRDLLLENDIKFLSLIGSNDVGWCYQVLFCSRRLLRVPNAYYIRRVHDASVSFRKREVPEHVHKWMDRTIRSLKYMSDFMERITFFRENPKFRYKVLSHFVESDFANITDICSNIEPFKVAEIFREKFGDYLGKHDVLVSMLCANINHKRKILKRDEQRIAELTKELDIAKKNKALPAVSTNFPAVSVIIPMYNAQNFIGECLKSLQLQTFKDFEIIVVDDCSTDNSVKLVKNFAKKFDMQIKTAKTKKNSGGGGYIPRNLGLQLSRGEYVFFLDADDFILSTALEKLYKAAKDTDADVVYTTSYYNLMDVNDVRRVRDTVSKDSPLKISRNKTTLTVDDQDGNLQNLLLAENMPASWRKFVRRELLIEKEIFFPEILTGGDFIWTIELYCYAKRFVRIPTPLYFYRSYNPESILRKQRDREKQVTYWMSAFVKWVQALNEVSKRTKILRENSDYCHKALMLKFSWCMGHLTEDVKPLYASRIYEFLCRNLNNENDFENLPTLAFFFGQIVLSRRRVTKLKQRVAELEAEIEQLKSTR